LKTIGHGRDQTGPVNRPQWGNAMLDRTGDDTLQRAGSKAALCAADCLVI
jgi:hypothetical protein